MPLLIETSSQLTTHSSIACFAAADGGRNYLLFFDPTAQLPLGVGLKELTFFRERAS